MSFVAKSVFCYQDGLLKKQTKKKLRIYWGIHTSDAPEHVHFCAIILPASSSGTSPTSQLLRFNLSCSARGGIPILYYKLSFFSESEEEQQTGQFYPLLAELVKMEPVGSLSLLGTGEEA